jgi:hypothetical protein
MYSWSTLGGVGKGGLERAAALDQENRLVGNTKPISDTEGPNTW